MDRRGGQAIAADMAADMAAGLSTARLKKAGKKVRGQHAGRQSTMYGREIVG